MTTIQPMLLPVHTNLSAMPDLCTKRSYEINRYYGQRFSAVVIGGGAAGIAALGNLLEDGKTDPIAWVDTEFRGGKVACAYDEVPSNTRVSFFISYATAVAAFREVIESTPTPNAFTVLADLPQDQTCSLKYAGDLLRMLSDGLARNKRVQCFRGLVTAVTSKDDDSTWYLGFQADGTQAQQTLHAARVVYCTGSTPTVTTLPGLVEKKPSLLHLDLALKPSALRKAISPSTRTSVAVIGASHSAILVLMNLVRIVRSSHPLLQIKWFTRSPTLKYAMYQDGKIFHDNTGLKGEAAEFAKEMKLDAETFETSSLRDIVTRVDCSGGATKEAEAYQRELPGCDLMIQAIGFTPNQLPDMNRKLQYDHQTGQFLDARSRTVVSGLYGAGIAFPERVVDPSGDEEYAVGFFKFMKFLKRVSPQWVLKTDFSLQDQPSILEDISAGSISVAG
ncbi:hypothetical protein PFICI_04864 [Pestalotiopsis fici W106-1]|uniref:FAD/NAD(P)-binding domain-containing protein n=1 Tax=Pestalotiopsis fici (strain W106-1 / CGMCC3.15140) TaxID=1229662 RepID=W3XA51_PESFW|nr:uncharacterized protein PFICI_04864 [Pestalotiopsis fici W106-1]ETS82988.1 hypothetical protein PFICI_04864 [Pestalotiopsis fici W106-1]